MDIKIFPAGFDVKEHNDFCNSNIIFQEKVTENGSVFVFYKSPEEIGAKAIDLIETLDKLVKQAETEILASSIDKGVFEAEIATFEKQKSQLHSNQDEWKKLDEAIKHKQFSIKMHDDTIANHTLKIEVIKAELDRLQNK